MPILPENGDKVYGTVFDWGVSYDALFKFRASRDV